MPRLIGIHEIYGGQLRQRNFERLHDSSMSVLHPHRLNWQFRIAVPILGHEFPPKVRQPTNENQIPFIW